ncbi:hypothetical protein H257_05251 [Aphanomyces astaci]|uniref:Uncharacterized protein n=1 Tax=Aphanomyces astaci TaxID=112090 RepID=W4GSJ7_APHAT|nr:hypothetical protein H257_05251 [Aphanomyces astaci]ETV82685.1 hypothetical protein H257_05251 [Aphanomyces astaci]|eukprot:XP_009828354.1 hypothetical protein H257_05251 [Aphanomyces astaci]
MEQPKRRQERYTNAQRKVPFAEFSMFNDWRLKEAKTLSSTRHGRHATLGGQGHKELTPITDNILAYM